MEVVTKRTVKGANGNLIREDQHLICGVQGKHLQSQTLNNILESMNFNLNIYPTPVELWVPSSLPAS